MSLHKPHADKQGFLNDYVRLAGLNTITGGAGADVLTGGAGVDTFVYAAGPAGELQTGDVNTGVIDVITDFDDAEDLISGFGVAGAGEFSFIAAASATYADALIAAGIEMQNLDNDYVLAAYGSGANWTAVVFIDIGAESGAGIPAGAIQIGNAGSYASEVDALSAITAGNFIA